MATVRVETNGIGDSTSFHLSCKEVFGFPDFYGMNMDAWIDCLSYLDEGEGMSKFHLEAEELLTIEVGGSEDFKIRLPELFDALVESADFVNQRYIDEGKSPKLVLAFQ